MKKLFCGFLALGLGLGSVGPVHAATFDLFEWALNVDGSVMDRRVGSLSSSAPMDAIPAGVDASGFNETTGLGTVTVGVTGGGAHYVGGFFDLEIEESINTYYNEVGSATDTAEAGHSWEIDEPSFKFGDIRTWTEIDGTVHVGTFDSASLDKLNAVPESSPDDVSMAQAWDFSLADGEQALVTFILGTEMPTSGFYLSQTDPDPVTNDDPATVYFRSTLDIGSVAPVPEPGTMILLGSGLVGLAGARRRKARR